VLTQQVKSISTSKTIKGVGTMSAIFVPDKNYLNLIFPGDYINLYIDRGNLDGWTRVFFGFIDRVQENCSIGDEGTPNTTYTVVCSDFAKALEKTMIYFNPYVQQDRKDFDSEWIGTPNAAGVALRTKGIAATGSPPDILLNNLFVMLGASSQFYLPKGYTANTKDIFRQKRAEFVVGRISKDILKVVPNGIPTVNFLQQVSTIASGKIPAEDIGIVIPESTSSVDRQAANEALSVVVKKFKTLSTDFQLQLKGVLSTTAPSFQTTLMDVLDCFTLVEREAIDGYCQDVTIWQKQGSIMSLLMAQSNENVNELFFDLRPVIFNNKVALAGGNNWSRAPDEIGHNLDAGHVPGIQYVPSVIFREYPFSTIQFLDASNIKLSLEGKKGTKAAVGKVQFGAIFSDAPNVKGRHVIQVENINLEDNARTKAGESAGIAYKHIDVAVISPTEIFSSNLGRSDHEHYNLTQYISDGLLGEDSKFYMHDLLPIVSSIGIARYGLRVRELNTSFARFAETNIPSAGDIAAPYDSEPTPEPPGVNDGSVGFPVDPTLSDASSPYGWRIRPNDNPPSWRYHHGQDIRGALDTPIMAVADGIVVAVARSGTAQFKGYGNTVIIKHNALYKGETVFSVYAHLHEISADLLAQSHNPEKNFAIPNAVSKDLLRAGRMTSFPITKGTVVGKMGKTRGKDAKNVQLDWGKNIGVHLHFEIIKGYPSKTTEIGVPPPVFLTGRVEVPEAELPPITPAERTALAAQKPTDLTPDALAKLNSINPKVFFLDHGINIETEEVFNPNGDDKENEVTDNVVPNEEELDKIDAPEASTTRSSNVDNSKTRSQIARWGLLDDHWYQHNIEYLSGNISMRGAPEIRVGYRLDINDPIRPLSFYVEGVDHEWSFPDKMTTSLTLTRGQCNSPFPVYVLPYLAGVRDNDVQRKTDSRLGKFFTFPSPKSARNGVFISDRTFDSSIPEDLDNSRNPDTEMLSNTNISSELVIPAGGSLDLGSNFNTRASVEEIIDQSIDLTQVQQTPKVSKNTSNIKK
jgi:murein DD-endopeptidase MepM/ murein hydrolase activator NlpD